MKRFLAFALVLLGSHAYCAGITFPEGGLPAGRLAISPVVTARQSTIGTANLFQNFMRGAGSSLPGASEIGTLDIEASRYAAGALVGQVPAALWADVMMGKDAEPGERARMLEAFKAYMGQASEAAAKDNADIIAKLQGEIAAGRLGQADLEDAAAALKGLAAHNPSLRASLSEVASAVETLKSRKISAVVAAETSSWGEKKAGALGPEVAGKESSGSDRLAASSPIAEKKASDLPQPKKDPAAPSKLKAAFRWAAPILAMTAAFIGLDWGTKAFAAHHLFNLFHEAAWRAPLMAIVIPFITFTAFKFRNDLPKDHKSWRWSAKQLGNGRLGWHKVELAGVDTMAKDHPSLKWAVRLFDVSIAMMIGGMLGNGIDLLRLGGALDWIPMGRSLMNFADVALLIGLSYFQLASHFFIKASEAHQQKKTLSFNTGGFLGLPLIGFFIAWAFGTGAGAGELDLSLKNVGFLYLMGFSMLIGIARYLVSLVVNRFAVKFIAEQDKMQARPAPPSAE